jgi:hypothetical protein
MKFRFEFDIKPLPVPISLDQPIFLIGSCFTENIGEKLKKDKFTVLENPNGILFNPVSVCETISAVIQQKQYTEADLFCLNETWHSWKHHSRFSGITSEDALQKMNEATSQAHEFLQKAGYLVLTLGSAWVYTLTDQASHGIPGTVVANNHKAPANWFEKRLMKPEEVEEMLSSTITALKAFNPGIQIIFTISPVRHLREGAVNNNRSKAVLIQAVHELIEKTAGLYYFPAYEIVIDDLRDYRFYAEDLVHPNYGATEYVWNKLVEACMSSETRALMTRIEDINLAYKHNPFNPHTKQHKKFLHTYLEKTTILQEECPYLDLQKELAYFAGKSD